MTEIGQTVDFSHVCSAANVTPEGFWGGILVNDRDNSLILIQNEDRSKPSKYPNYWDENVMDCFTTVVPTNIKAKTCLFKI